MFSIRAMTRSDLDRVLQIISAQNKIDGENADEYYRRYFSDDDRVVSPRERHFVATMDPEGLVVGIAGFCPDKDDWKGVLWLTWFYVAPEYRERGIGTKLLRCVIDQVRELGIRKLYVDTSTGESFATAVSMYKRFGFREEGRLLDYYEEGEHCPIFGLRLDATSNGRASS